MLKFVKGEKITFLAKKVVKRFVYIENVIYLCIVKLRERDAPQNRGVKKKLKKVAERFGDMKNFPYLCNKEINELLTI